MQPIARPPRPMDGQGDIRGLALKERFVNMGLQSGWRCPRRAHSRPRRSKDSLAEIHGFCMAAFARSRTDMSFPQPHPRLSTLSSTSVSSTDYSSPTTSSRFSLPSTSVTTALPAKPLVRPNIYDRNLNKTRTAEVSASAFAFLFSEIVQYTQKGVSGINDLERRCVRRSRSPFYQKLMCHVPG